MTDGSYVLPPVEAVADEVVNAPEYSFRGLALAAVAAVRKAAVR